MLTYGSDGKYRVLSDITFALQGGFNRIVTNTPKCYSYSCKYCCTYMRYDHYDNVCVCCARITRYLRGEFGSAIKYVTLLTGATFYQIGTCNRGEYLFWDNDVIYARYDSYWPQGADLARVLNSTIEFDDKLPIKRLIAHKYALLQYALNQRDVSVYIMCILLCV